MSYENLSKMNLQSVCKDMGIEYKQKSKIEMVAAIKKQEISEIEAAINHGTDFDLLKSKIQHLADEYADNLKGKIDARKEEMKSDDNAHYLVYRVLGISAEEGAQIDVYQNTGRFLYKYAGSFLEEAASLCLFFANREGGKTTVKNTQGQRPKTFEIDFLNQNDAIELKWRDATTDGDHITKEHTRACVIA